jgi:hypothetical protein
VSLTLLVPDLFWPDRTVASPAAGLPLTHLSRIAARGRVTPGDADSLETWFARRLGLEPHRAPWARWMAAAHARTAAPGALLATPVHLRAQGVELFLVAGAALAVHADEAAALQASIAAMYATDGIDFDVLTPDRWLVSAPTPIALDTVPVGVAHGRSIDALRPRGDDARRWAARGAEIEMLLHDHPVNAAREARGAPAINALWWWGSGPASADAGGFTHVHADDAAISGWARACGLATASAAVAPAPTGQALVVIDTARAAAMQGDMTAWRAAVAAIDAGPVADAVAAVAAGQHDALQLVGFGARRCVTLDWRARDRWNLWRRPRPFDATLLPA